MGNAQESGLAGTGSAADGAISEDKKQTIIITNTLNEKFHLTSLIISSILLSNIACESILLIDINRPYEI